MFQMNGNDVLSNNNKMSMTVLEKFIHLANVIKVNLTMIIKFYTIVQMFIFNEKN